MIKDNSNNFIKLITVTYINKAPIKDTMWARGNLISNKTRGDIISLNIIKHRFYKITRTLILRLSIFII